MAERNLRTDLFRLVIFIAVAILASVGAGAVSIGFVALLAFLSGKKLVVLLILAGSAIISYNTLATCNKLSKIPIVR